MGATPAAVSKMCKRLEKTNLSWRAPELEKRSRRRMTKIAQLCAHASQQIINLQGSMTLRRRPATRWCAGSAPVCGVSSGLNQKTTAS
jgi:hypothetical protein